MRDSLTVLAILLIGVLTAALVGPYVIDWNGQRGLIERRLTRAAGTPVTVAGPIDVKLLPTPRFRVGSVTIGDGKADRPRLTAAAVEAEISLTALLRGQVQIVDTTLDAPRLDLEQAPDGSIALALPPEDTAGRIAVDHIGFRDGTVALTLADGRRETLSGLDADGAATSLRGPFRLTGQVAGLPFRLVTGAIDQGRLRVKLHVDGQALRPAVDLDGMVAQRPGRVGPGFDGSATLAGSLPLEGTAATVPWSLAAHVSADRDAATATEVELRAGGDMRALIARGEGEATSAASAVPALRLKLHGAALDLDRLAVATTETEVPLPRGLDLARALGRGLGIADAAGATSLPLRLALDLGFDTATVDGQTLLGTEARLGLGPEPTAALFFAAEGPQGARLSLDGLVDPGPARAVAGAFGAVPAPPAATFRGHADIRSADLARTAAWLSPLAPGLATTLAGLPGRSLQARAEVAASATGLVARDLSLDLGGSSFAGLLSLTRAVGSDRARLFADLSSDALVLDRLPDLSTAWAAQGDADLDLSLQARAVTVIDPGPRAAGAGAGPIAGGHLALHLTRTGDDLRLQRLAVEVDGASLEGTAERGKAAARGEIHIVAGQLGPLARRLASALPAAAAAELRDRAAGLSPLDLTMTGEAAVTGPDGWPVPLRLTLSGTAGATRIDATATPAAGGTGAALPAEDRPLVVTLSAKTPEAADLLHGGHAAPAAGRLGGAEITGEARGSVSGGFSVSAEGALGAAKLAFRGAVHGGAGAGRLTLTSADAGSLLGALIGTDVPAGVPADVGADIAWTGPQVELRDLSGAMAGSKASGALQIDLAPRRDGAGALEPVIRGALAIDRLPASALFDLAFGASPPAAPGAVWSAAPFPPAPGAPIPSRLSLKVATLPLRDGLVAHDVAFDLATRGSATTLSDAAGKLDGGLFGGALTLRREAGGDSLSGQVTWTDVGIDLGAVSGRASGRQEVSASGSSPAALVASLAGSGRLTLRGGALARTDPAAPTRTLAAVVARDVAAERASGGTDVTPTDADALVRDLSAQLDQGPLRLAEAEVPTTLLGGIWRFGPLTQSGTVQVAARGQGGEAVDSPWTADASASFDVGALALSTRASLRGAGPAPTASGVEVVVSRSGPVGREPVRRVDASALAGAVQALAIARAQDRIDVLEQDIRERAAFNRQLKATQAQEQAEKDRAEAERQAAALQAAADAKAKADAARAAADARKAEAARIRAQTEDAVRAAGAAAQEAEKQRFFDKALRTTPPPLDRGGNDDPLPSPEHRERRDPRPSWDNLIAPPAPPDGLR